jgi:hypothetical protein
MGDHFLLVGFLVPIMGGPPPLRPVLVPFMGGPMLLIPVKTFLHPSQPMSIGSPSTSLPVSTLLFLLVSLAGVFHVILLMSTIPMCMPVATMLASAASPLHPFPHEDSSSASNVSMSF